MKRHVKSSWQEDIVGDTTVGDIIRSARWSQDGCMESVVKPSHEGGETELILLAAMRGKQIRVFHDRGDTEVVEPLPPPLCCSAGQT